MRSKSNRREQALGLTGQVLAQHPDRRGGVACAQEHPGWAG